MLKVCAEKLALMKMEWAPSREPDQANVLQVEADWLIPVRVKVYRPTTRISPDVR
jgi:hypothetical protein